MNSTEEFVLVQFLKSFDSSNRTRVAQDQNSRIGLLCYASSRTQKSHSTNIQVPIYLNFKSQLCWGQKNSVNAENNFSFIYMLFKLYVQV